MPRAASFAALNAKLLDDCRRRLGDRLRGHAETIGERLARDLAAFHALPGDALRRLREEDGPGQLAVAGALSRQRLLGADRLRPPRGADPRLCPRGGDLLRRRHHRPACPLLRAGGLRLRPAALPGAARAEGRRPRPGGAAGRLGSARRVRHRCAGSWRRAWASAANGSSSRSCDCWRAFRRDDVVAGVSEAMARGAIGFDAVKHLVLCRIERRPPRLDLTVYPYLPRATVATTSARTYMDLLTGVAS